MVRYKFRERATIAKILSQPLSELDEAHALKLRVRFIHNLAIYCYRQESRRHKAISKSMPFRFKDEEEKGEFGPKRCLNDCDNARTRKWPKAPKEVSYTESPFQESRDNTRSIIPIKEEDIKIIQNLYPMAFTGLVCLICISNEKLLMAKPTRLFVKKGHPLEAS
jgi:hypothetical protein